MKRNNAIPQAEVYFGMHFCDGVCKYEDAMVFIPEVTARRMNETFTGKPVYVDHPEKIEDNEEFPEDGFVTRSFLNKADGKHWAEFVVFTETAKKAIRDGWQLSNCYVPKSVSAGGLWNNVPYQEEVIDAEYEHLAIVPNPRYAESRILTPKEFEKYNADMTSGEKRYINNKGDNEMNFFKKVKNETDLSGVSVVLPKSGKEMTITKLVNAMDDLELERSKEPEAKAADMNDWVEVEGVKMTVAELINAYKSEKSETDTGDDEPAYENEDDEEKKKNDEAEEKKKKEKEEEDKKKKENASAAKKTNEEFKNKGKSTVTNLSEHRLNTRQDSLAIGKSRYGS